MSLRNLFDEEQVEIKEFSLDERIEIIGLSKRRKKALEKIQVKVIEYDAVENYKTSIKTINTDKIVGLARPFGDKTWLDVLSNKYCHKNKNFRVFNAETFNEVLLSEQSDGYPTVVKYRNKYYISGNGLHRLTIAKCIGNKRAKVVVEKRKK